MGGFFYYLAHPKASSKILYHKILKKYFNAPEIWDPKNLKKGFLALFQSYILSLKAIIINFSL